MQQLELNWGHDTHTDLLAHPQANRYIVLAQHNVLYVLQRRRRKTVGMRIGEYGLEVAAPNRASLAEIEAIIRSKSAWIVRHLQAGAQQARSAQQQRPIWQDGVYLLWQDGLLQVRCTIAANHVTATPPKPQTQRKIIQTAHLQTLDAEPNTTSKATHILWLATPTNTQADTLCALTHSWIQHQAHTIFTQRLNHYAPILGVQYSTLKISNAKTRWGSANSRGTICLHWRLLQMPSAVLDYVVVHELAHLHEMNHGKRFWAWVERILPDYRMRQQLLKTTQLPPW